MTDRKVRIENHTFVADIPKKYALKMGLKHREIVDVSYENDSIIIRKKPPMSNRRL